MKVNGWKLSFVHVIKLINCYVIEICENNIVSKRNCNVKQTELKILFRKQQSSIVLSESENFQYLFQNIHR